MNYVVVSFRVTMNVATLQSSAGTPRLRLTISNSVVMLSPKNKVVAGSRRTRRPACSEL